MRREKKKFDPLGLHEKVIARRKEMKNIRETLFLLIHYDANMQAEAKFY